MGYFKCLINAVIGKVEFWHDLAGVHPALFPVSVSVDSGLLVSWLHNDGNLSRFALDRTLTVIGGFG